jgi:molybdopterin synthase sulfur carrier subunit
MCCAGMDTVRILYFAWLRERAGRAEEHLVLPADVATVGGLMTWLGARDDGLRDAFGQAGLVRAAVNQNFAANDTPIRAGDEVALFPPITGG